MGMFNKPISILENQLAKGKKSGLNLMTGVGSLAGAAAGTDIGYISGSNSMSIGSPNDPDYLSDKGRNIKMGIGAIAGAALGGYGARKGISSFINRRLDGLVDVNASVAGVALSYRRKLGQEALGEMHKDDFNNMVANSRYFKVEKHGEKTPFYLKDDKYQGFIGGPFEREQAKSGGERDKLFMANFDVKMRKRDAINGHFPTKLDFRGNVVGNPMLNSLSDIDNTRFLTDMTPTI